MKVQNLRKLLSLAERPATGLNLPQISFNAEATQISKRMCRNSGRGQVPLATTHVWAENEGRSPPATKSIYLYLSILAPRHSAHGLAFTTFLDAALLS